MVPLGASPSTDDCSWVVELVEVGVQREEETKEVVGEVQTLAHFLSIG